jgi:hypothetical protein
MRSTNIIDTNRPLAVGYDWVFQSGRYRFWWEMLYPSGKPAFPSLDSRRDQKGHIRRTLPVRRLTENVH